MNHHPSRSKECWQIEFTTSRISWIEWAEYRSWAARRKGESVTTTMAFLQWYAMGSENLSKLCLLFYVFWPKNFPTFHLLTSFYTQDETLSPAPQINIKGILRPSLQSPRNSLHWHSWKISDFLTSSALKRVKLFFTSLSLRGLPSIVPHWHIVSWVYHIFSRCLARNSNEELCSRSEAWWFHPFPLTSLFHQLRWRKYWKRKGNLRQLRVKSNH